MAEQKVHVVLWREGDQFVAWCLEYDIASQGDNPEHAMEMIREAVELYIEDMSPEELEAKFVPVESMPVVEEMTIHAPAAVCVSGSETTLTT